LTEKNKYPAKVIEIIEIEKDISGNEQWMG